MCAITQPDTLGRLLEIRFAAPARGLLALAARAILLLCGSQTCMRPLFVPESGLS